MKFFIHIDDIDATGVEITDDITKESIANIEEEIDLEKGTYAIPYISIKLCDITGTNKINSSNYYNVLKNLKTFYTIEDENSTIIYRGYIDENSLKQTIENGISFINFRIVSMLTDLEKQKICIPTTTSPTTRTPKQTVEYILGLPSFIKVGKYESDGGIQTSGQSSHDFELVIKTETNKIFPELNKYENMYIFIGEEIIKIKVIIDSIGSTVIYFDEENREQFNSARYETDEDSEVYVLTDVVEENYIAECENSETNESFIEILVSVNQRIIETGESSTDINYTTTNIFSRQHHNMYKLEPLNNLLIIKEDVGFPFSADKSIHFDPEHQPGTPYYLVRVDPVCQGTFYKSETGISNSTVVFRMLFAHSQHYYGIGFYSLWGAYNTSTQEWISFSDSLEYEGIWTEDNPTVMRKKIINKNSNGTPYNAITRTIYPNSVIYTTDMFEENSAVLYPNEIGNNPAYTYIPLVITKSGMRKIYIMKNNLTEKKIYYHLCDIDDITYDNFQDYYEDLETGDWTEIDFGLTSGQHATLESSYGYNYSSTIASNKYTKIIRINILDSSDSFVKLSIYYLHYDINTGITSIEKYNDLYESCYYSGIGFINFYSRVYKHILSSSIYNLACDNKSKLYVLNEYRKMISNLLVYEPINNKIILRDMQQIININPTYYINPDTYTILDISRISQKDIMQSYFTNFQDEYTKSYYEKKAYDIFKENEYTVLTIKSSNDAIFDANGNFIASKYYKVFDVYYLKTKDQTYNCIILGVNYKTTGQNEYKILVYNPETIFAYQNSVII